MSRWTNCTVPSRPPLQVDALRAELSGWVRGLQEEMARLGAASEARDREAARRERLMENLLEKLSGVAVGGSGGPPQATPGKIPEQPPLSLALRQDSGLSEVHC
jgi:hypothetical protein